jgi:hypothetical protein
MPKLITIQNIDINIKTSKDDNDYFSLTDMAKWKNAESPDQVISNWMRTNFTIQFLGFWEIQSNPNFNPVEFEGFRNQSGENTFLLSPSKWIKTTNAIGIRSSSGRYGGTFAHRDIAFEFASWLSPEFKLYIIKEFQRLKELEKTTTQSLEWQIKRSLTKTNYKIQTKAIQLQLQNLGLNKFQESLRYADEADILNLILFGKKAKDWEKENPELYKQGLNMRDVADIENLIVLSGLETINAYLLNQNTSKEIRIQELTKEAKKNLSSIQNQKSTLVIKNLTNSLDV